MQLKRPLACGTEVVQASKVRKRHAGIQGSALYANTDEEGDKTRPRCARVQGITLHTDATEEGAAEFETDTLKDTEVRTSRTRRHVLFTLFANKDCAVYENVIQSFMRKKRVIGLAQPHHADPFNPTVT
ncbi:hypothetical protein B0H10DRAFT_1942187 [Mycena sp. CBHHK59/15]|nr:hypothetical protein B0H10DRAFT_1942187 [Mycena sp. CBHHK59/15]